VRNLPNPRVNRLSEEIKKIVSHIIHNELRDPRIAKMTSVMDVEVTKDLRYANVFVSIFGDHEVQSNTMEALKSSSGFVRREVGQRVKARYIPEIVFKLDRSIERGFEIQSVLSKLNEKAVQRDEEQGE
jgi:ribosome-binding factor A